VADKSTHQEIAETVVAKVKASVRKGLNVTSKSSYSIIGDESSWLVRLTPKIAEFNKSRVSPDELEAAGLIDTGKDGMHRKHALAAAPAAPGEEGEAVVAEGAGLEEMVAGIEKAARKPKAAKAEAKKAGAAGGKAGDAK
jgi:hypothetical protein